MNLLAILDIQVARRHWMLFNFEVSVIRLVRRWEFNRPVISDRCRDRGSELRWEVGPAFG